MPANTFGERFRVTTAGVSHGPGYLCIIDGCPSGLLLSVDDLLPDLRRRRPGQSKIVTQRDEPDMPEIWSGVFEGKTDGSPIGITFRNADQKSADYADIRDKYRPGHADYTFDAKFGFRDYRGGGRSSARGCCVPTSGLNSFSTAITITTGSSCVSAMRSMARARARAAGSAGKQGGSGYRSSRYSQMIVES